MYCEIGCYEIALLTLHKEDSLWVFQGIKDFSFNTKHIVLLWSP